MWPFRKKALTVTSEVRQAISGGVFNPLPMLGGGSQQRITEAFQTAKTANYSWLYGHSPAVRSVIDAIVRNVGQLDLRLYEEIDDSERQPQYDHPAAMSLRYPSETVPADQFIRTMFRDYLTSADAVAIMLPGPSNRVMFKWVPISRVQFLGSNMFDSDTYRIHNQLDGTFTDIPAANILHWRGENPDDPRIGLSHLETLRGVIAEDAALQQATVELANSGLTQPVYGYRPVEAPEISNEARKGLEEDLANRMRSANRRPFILEEGTELRPYGVSPRDAQMVEVRRWAIERVAAEYGVPLGMVGLADDLEQARSAFYTDTLPPYCEEFTKMLNLQVLVRVYNWTDGCFEFNLDEKHMGDDRVTALVSATGRAVMTTNEGRARINLPPIDTGDELVTPLNVIVGDNPKPSVDVMPVQDPNGPPQDGSGRQEDTPAAPPKALVKAEEFTPVPQLVPSRKTDLDRQHRNIDLAKATVERHFNRLERSLRAKAGNADWNRWDREFADDIHRTVEQIVEKEGTIYAFKLTGTFDMGMVKNYLRAMAEGAATGINDKIRQEIDDLGLDGALNQRASHVEAAGTGLGAGATRWAREEAARQSPSTEHRTKTWIADTSRHAEFDGDTVGLNDDWPAGFAPGTAPGCACSMSIS